MYYIWGDGPEAVTLVADDGRDGKLIRGEVRSVKYFTAIPGPVWYV
jgi:hypothetical protein